MTPEIPVELGCPQCGAPVILEETDRILSCGFCRVRLCLAFQGTSNYRLTTPDLPEAGLLYIPYWRYRGMEFSVEGLEIRHRVSDHSRLAIKASGLPPTLGFRPQVLKLKPMTAGMGNRFLKPELTFQQVRASTNGSISKPFNGAGDPRSQSAFEALVGETVHLIHSPVLHTDDGFWDPILRRPLVEVDAAALNRLARDQSPGESIRFLPMICPTCGWDLAGEKDTLAPVCRNCHSIWDSGGGRLSRLPFGVAPSGGKGREDLHLPFWKIRASVSVLQLETQGDLIRLANVPRVLDQNRIARKLDYYVAAFKVHPQLFLRLARSFTLGQPARGLARELPKSPLHPVTLPLAEALETLPILVGSMAVPKKTYLPMISGLKFQPVDSQLVFFPFELKGTELIQNDIGMSISCNALGMGRLI